MTSLPPPLRKGPISWLGQIYSINVKSAQFPIELVKSYGDHEIVVSCNLNPSHPSLRSGQRRILRRGTIKKHCLALAAVALSDDFGGLYIDIRPFGIVLQNLTNPRKFLH